MVEKKEIVTLFKIKKLDEEYEALIPFGVVDGTYNEENCTFMTPDGIVYQHIEEATYPNIGYAKRTIVDIDNDAKENDFTSIDFAFERKFNTDTAFKYLRFIKEPNTIYIKSKFSNGLKTLIDEDSKKYKENNDKIKEKQIVNSNQTERKNNKNYDDKIQSGYLGIDKTPKEICELVKKTIKGQDEAIKTIVTCLWTTINSRHLTPKITKKQMILVGPTGVGKTAIFKKLASILDIPIVIFSVPGLSQAGYVGRSTDEILKQVYFETMQNIDVAQKAIVILDEYDKIAYNGNDKSGDISTVGVQNELLKMIEGYNRVIQINDGQDNFEIDTSDMIFIATGAFQELFEKEKNNQIGFSNNQQKDKKEEKIKITGNDLVKYGLKKESIGRLPIIVCLNELTREIFREIILESDESELLAHITFLESYGITVSNLDEIIETLIDDAIEKGIGARGLTATISKLFIDIIYEVANNPNKYEAVYLGKNIINDPSDYQLKIKPIIKQKIKSNHPSKLCR